MQDPEETVCEGLAAGLTAEPSGPPHVLVLDDDVDTVEMLAFVLRHAKYRVTAVSNVSAAHAGLEQDLPHIVVLDVSLGGEPLGLDVARAARAKERIKVVLHTALPEDLVRAQFDAYDAFLRKPTSGRAMLTVIADMLTRAR